MAHLREKQAPKIPAEKSAGPSAGRPGAVRPMVFATQSGATASANSPGLDANYHIRQDTRWGAPTPHRISLTDPRVRNRPASTRRSLMRSLRWGATGCRSSCVLGNKLARLAEALVLGIAGSLHVSQRVADHLEPSAFDLDPFSIAQARDESNEAIRPNRAKRKRLPWRQGGKAWHQKRW